tara:strand:- start:188 stop:769 length:582 start_codon:yes stop_codon:yes gene_type:complete
MQKINEGILSRTADLFYAFKFLKLLTKPWTETKAFELGLIDNKGKVLKKAKTSDEKSAYTVFNRLVFNVKRLLPGNKIASYAAALFLIKEHTGIPESKLKSILEEATGETITDTHFNENKWFETDTGLNKGTYTLTENAVSPITGEVIALKGTKVNVQEKTTPCSTILGKSIYKVVHIPTNQEIYVSNGDIKR